MTIALRFNASVSSMLNNGSVDVRIWTLLTKNQCRSVNLLIIVFSMVFASDNSDNNIYIFNNYSILMFYIHTIFSEPGRTKDLELTVRESSESHLCETYPGPTNLGDQILMTCPLLRAQYVRIQIRSQSGKTDVLQVCELQVFGKL